MRAVTTTECQYIASKEYDADYLHRMFLAVNNRFFQDTINANVLWQVPKGTVSLFIGEPGKKLLPGNSLYDVFEFATKLIRSGQRKEAIPYLEQCAEAEHPDSELLLSHILMRAGNERWQHYAEAYSKHTATVRAVPAACYYADSATIAIHPHLQEVNTPQFVLKYLIYHECCHQIIHCTDDEPHPEEFMRMENQAPARDRALAWLEKKGFPTLRTSHAP